MNGTLFRCDRCGHQVELPADAPWDNRVCATCGARYQRVPPAEDRATPGDGSPGWSWPLVTAVCLALVVVAAVWFNRSPRPDTNAPRLRTNGAEANVRAPRPGAPDPPAAAAGDLSVASSGQASRNWRFSVSEASCTPQLSRLTLQGELQYLGPSGLVQSPALFAIDESGKRYSPANLGFKDVPPDLAAWLLGSLQTGGGGLYRLISGRRTGTFSLQFALPGTVRGVRWGLADIEPFPVADANYRSLSGLCAALRASPRARPVERTSRQNEGGSESRTISYYSGMYPCARGGDAVTMVRGPRPKGSLVQVLMIGRRYLPSATAAETDEGNAPAQGYMYLGPDDGRAIEEFGRAMIARDFPQYCISMKLPASGALFAGHKYYAVNLGGTRQANMIVIAIYAVRACR